MPLIVLVVLLILFVYAQIWQAHYLTRVFNASIPLTLTRLALRSSTRLALTSFVERKNLQSRNLLVQDDVQGRRTEVPDRVLNLAVWFHLASTLSLLSLVYTVLPHLASTLPS